MGGDATGADLTVWIASPSLLFGDVTVALCARRSLLRVSQSLPVLPASPLTATHRQGHKHHYQHDGDGNNDDNDSRRYRGHGDQQGIAHFRFLHIFRRGGYPTRRVAHRFKHAAGVVGGHGRGELIDTFRW